LQCEYFGMKGMQLLHNTIERVRAKLNPQLRISGILATIHKSRTLHSQEVLELVRERYGDVVFDVVIKDSIRFAETPLPGCRSCNTPAAPKVRTLIAPSPRRSSSAHRPPRSR